MKFSTEEVGPRLSPHCSLINMWHTHSYGAIYHAVMCLRGLSLEPVPCCLDPGVVVLSRGDMNKHLFTQVGHRKQTKETISPKSNLVSKLIEVIGVYGWGVTSRSMDGSKPTHYWKAHPNMGSNTQNLHPGGFPEQYTGSPASQRVPLLNQVQLLMLPWRAA